MRLLPSFLRRFDSTNPTVVHLDGDLYSSTSVVLYMLAPNLKDADILIFDDFFRFSARIQSVSRFLFVFSDRV